MGWSNTVSEPAFGAGSAGDASIKNKLINLTTSVRTLMRSMFPPLYHGLGERRGEERMWANKKQYR